MARQPTELSPEIAKRRARLYELVPQMRLYHRVVASLVWEPFVMRAGPPNLRRDTIQTDGWGLRRTIDAKGKGVTVESVARDAPVDLLCGASFCFGVGASGDAATLASRLSGITGRATVSLTGHQHTLAQNFIQFMFFAGRFDAVRNIVVAGLSELFFFHTCEALFRQYGMFPFNRRFMTSLNGDLTETAARALYGAERRPFVPLTHTPERRDAERDLLRATIRDLLTTWTRCAAGMGARLTVMQAPTPALQRRRLSDEEGELLGTYDEVSGIDASLKAAIDDYKEWHRDEMAALGDDLGFTWVDINEDLGAAHDGQWLHVDRMHMTDQGYRAVAEALAPRLVD